MADTDEQPYVFIAYSTHEDDIPVVMALERLLQAEGFVTFRDRDIRSGVDYQVELNARLEQATVVLACWSHTALEERYHLRSEVDRTIELDRSAPLPTGEPRYLPIGLNGFTRDDLPLGVERFQMCHEFDQWDLDAEAACYQDLRSEIDERIRKASDLRREQQEEPSVEASPLERRLRATLNRSHQLEKVEREKGDAGWPVFCVQGTNDDLILRLGEHLMIRQDNDGYQALREYDRINALQPLVVGCPAQEQNYERTFLDAIDVPSGLDTPREKLRHWFAGGGWPMRVVYTSLEYRGDPRRLQAYAREARRIGDAYARHFPGYRVYFLFGAIRAQTVVQRILLRLRNWFPGIGAGWSNYVDLGELGLIRDQDIEPWCARIQCMKKRYRLDALKERLCAHNDLDLINGVRYRALDSELLKLLIEHRRTGRTPQ